MGISLRCAAFGASRFQGFTMKFHRQELTDEQKQEIKEAFDLFDTDGSG